MTKPYRMVHPGPRHPERVSWRASRLIHKQGRCGEAGQSLQRALARFAQDHAILCGNGTIRNCHLLATRFTTGGPARDGKAANYTWIRDFGAAYLPEATFTFGIDHNRDAFVHCHAVLDSEHLPHQSAGHLFASDCIVAGAFEVNLNGLPDITLTQGPDAETYHSVFEPSGSLTSGEALFIRPRPNEDVTQAVEHACARAGLANGRIEPSIGSLNAPVLIVDGNDKPLSSVGMEVECFTGRIHNGKADLAARLCNEEGKLIEGMLKYGHAPICVTAELVVVSD